MPIINSVISAGKTPTGTKTITSNGVVDVVDYANADVQVPTTAPDYYIEKIKNSSNKLVNSTNLMNFSGIDSIGNSSLAYAYYQSPITSYIDMSDITSIDVDGCYNMFSGSSVSGVDLSSLTTVRNSGCQQMFNGCSRLTSFDLSSLTTIESTGCYGMFYNCTNLTGSVDLSNITFVGNSGLYNMFYNTHITSIKGTSHRYADYSNAFCYCPYLETADLSSLVAANGFELWNTFEHCSLLRSVDLSNLERLGDTTWAAANCLRYCPALTTFSFYSLKSAKGNHCLEKVFERSTGLTDVYFPSFSPSSFGVQHNIFDNMLSGVTGCTVHFPSNIQSTISSWTNIQNGMGGTNTNILYDLPATVILTGADTVQYERNPKNDTGTSLCWRIKDTLAIDAVSYYTSGTTDPQVGDTIYSDAACTTAVTTISSIA